jgi:hypothetical protein
MPMTLRNPVSLEGWQQILIAVDSATTFHDHVSTFQGSQPVRITAELTKILEHFRTDVQRPYSRSGTTSSRASGSIPSTITSRFSEATGDNDDFVMINSISGGRAT